MEDLQEACCARVLPHFASLPNCFLSSFCTVACSLTFICICFRRCRTCVSTAVARSLLLCLPSLGPHEAPPRDRMAQVYECMKECLSRAASAQLKVRPRPLRARNVLSCREATAVYVVGVLVGCFPAGMISPGMPSLIIVHCAWRQGNQWHRHCPLPWMAWVTMSH